MSCDLCHCYPHLPGCPNEEEYFTLSNYMCSICKDNIYVGEKYVVNADKEYAHIDCMYRPEDMAEFLGYEIEEMKE